MKTTPREEVRQHLERALEANWQEIMILQREVYSAEAQNRYRQAVALGNNIQEAIAKLGKI